MDKADKVSIAGAGVVFLASLVSLFSALYVPSFSLGNTGFIAGMAMSLAAIALIYANEKRKSSEMRATTAMLGAGMFFLLVSLQSYTDIFSGATALVISVAAFATMYSGLNARGLTIGRIAGVFFVMLLIFVFVQNLYAVPASQIARGAGTVLSDNWWESLNWIRNNTPECAIVATYWDPGHFIRSIAERSVIFDGATQGAIRELPAPGHADGLVVTPYDNGIKQITVYKDGNATTSRINDIAISLMTSNESLALETLSQYRDPRCDSMYYIASSDLIGKSTWWSYFSTWDPTTSKGVPANYYIANLGNVRPLVNQNALAYTYPIGQNQAFLVIGDNNTFKAYLQQGNSQPVAIETLIFYTDSGQALMSRDPDAQVKGTFLLQPDKRVGVFMPQELQGSMFTKMFLFNGAGLEHFQYVEQWGGEVKLFKINFPEAGAV